MLIMKQYFPTIAAVLGLSAHTAAFTTTPQFHFQGSLLRTQSTIPSSSGSTTLLRAAELEPEPEGGEELTKISSSMQGSRMKNMGPDGKEEGVFNFWLTATADGKNVKKFRVQTEKEASKKANFPGFRKGQIPPYAQPQMTRFAVQEAIIKTCEASLEAYGLESLPGNSGEVSVKEDLTQICKGYNYKNGADVPFTATYRGKFDIAVQDAMKSLAQESSAEDVVVDVEVVAEESSAEDAVVDVEVVAE